MARAMELLHPTVVLCYCCPSSLLCNQTALLQTLSLVMDAEEDGERTQRTSRLGPHKSQGTRHDFHRNRQLRITDGPTLAPSLIPP